MIGVRIAAAGVIGPGLDGWADACAVLRGERAYEARALPALVPQRLPANELRRATPTIRIAFRAAEDALSGGGVPAEQLAAVFGSSGGDVDVVSRLCTALAQPRRVISPTDFHNSVHNAPAGYWAIATGSRLPSTTVGAYDATFAAVLLEAACALADGMPVLAVAYDQPHLPPMRAKRDVSVGFASALVLSPSAGRAAQLTLTDEPETRMDDAALEHLRCANPAARALPLLTLLAREQTGRVVLPATGGRNLAVELER